MSSFNDSLFTKLERLKIAAPKSTGHRGDLVRWRRGISSRRKNGYHYHSVKGLSSASASSAASPDKEPPRRLKAQGSSHNNNNNNFQSLIYDCSRLRISSERQDSPERVESPEPHEPKVPPERDELERTCSQQALNMPCDVTIDELASYFENYVHIPRKMTTMAEMMYT